MLLMKTNRPLLTLAICLGLIALALISKVWLPAMRTAHTTASTSSANDSIVKTNAGSNTAGNDRSFFKTITDLQTGQYAVVNADQTKVILKDKNGKVIWTTNVMATMPPKMQQVWGNKISYLELFSNRLVVSVGRATSVIDKETGNLSGWSSD